MTYYGTGSKMSTSKKGTNMSGYVVHQAYKFEMPGKARQEGQR